MNNSYFSSFNDYTPSYNYSFQYSSPSTSTYCSSPLFLPPPPCPVHSPRIFCTSTPSSMNVSSIPYNYYQEQQSQVNSPSVQQRMYQTFFSFTIKRCKSSDQSFISKTINSSSLILNVIFFFRD